MSYHVLLHIELTGKTLYFADKDVLLDNGIFYEGRLEVGILRSSYGGFLSDTPVMSSLNISLKNIDDGLNEDLDAYSWANRVIKVYEGEGTDWAGYGLKFQGIIRWPNSFSRDSNKVSFCADDIRARDVKSLPATHFDSGSPIPILYGKFADPCYLPLTLKEGDTYQIAEHAIKEFDGVYYGTEKRNMEITHKRTVYWNGFVKLDDGGVFDLALDWHCFFAPPTTYLFLRGGIYSEAQGKLYLEIQTTTGDNSRLIAFDGDNWEEIKSFSQYTRDLAEFDNKLFRTELQKIYRSEDGGDTWILDYTAATVVRVMRNHPSRGLYIGCGGGQVYRRSLAGTWNLEYDYPSGIQSIGFAGGNGVYVGSTNGHIYRHYHGYYATPYTDLGDPGGSGWSVFGLDGLGDFGLFACTEHAVFRYLDETAQWEPVDYCEVGGTNYYIYYAIYSPKANKIFIGTEASGGSRLFSFDGQKVKLEKAFNSAYAIYRIVLYPVGNDEYIVLGPLGQWGAVHIDSKISSASDLKITAKGRMDGGDNLIEQPTSIIKDLLTSYCGAEASEIDESSRIAVQNYLKGTGDFKIHRYINSDTDSDQLIEEICRETGILIRVSNGKYYFDHWKMETDPVASYTEIEAKSPRTRDFDFYANRMTVNWKYDPASEEFNDSLLAENSVAQAKDLTTRAKVLDFYWRYDDNDNISVEDYLDQLLELCSSHLQIVNLDLAGDMQHDLAERIKISHLWMAQSILFIRGIVDHLGLPVFGIVGWNEDYIPVYLDQFWQTPHDKIYVPTETSFETLDTLGVALHGRRQRIAVMIKNATMRVQAKKTDEDTLTSTIASGEMSAQRKWIELDISSTNEGDYWDIELQAKKDAENPEISRLIMLMGV